MFYNHCLRVKQIVYMSALLGLKWPPFTLWPHQLLWQQIRLTYSLDVNNSVTSIKKKRRKKIKFCEESFSAKVDKSYQGQHLGFGSSARGRMGQLERMDACHLLEGLEHEELLEDLGLTGLPDLPRQEHLIHHRVHL